MSRFKSAGTTEHGFFEERLSAYMDGELTPREHERVEQHVKNCSACQWELETLAQTIQWTRELPTLQVPRVFTVPVPAEPARSSVRRWNFLPVLQGATALIALLLVFAVAGDLMLGRLPTQSAPDATYQQEVASGEAEVAKVVEATVAVEAPAAAEAPVVAEAPAPVEVEREVGEVIVETLVETIVVESEVVAEPTEAPLAEGVSPTMPLVSGETMAPEATSQPPADRATWESAPEEPVEEAAMLEADAATAEGEAVPTAVAEEAVAGGGEPPMNLTAPSAPITVTEPSTVAMVTEQELASVTERDESELQTSGESGVNWLRVVEISLGGVLILLAAATVVFTIKRRRVG